MQLSLKKPIIFFDLETTGLSITGDRIVEMSIIKVNPNGEEEEYNYRFNPEIEIGRSRGGAPHIECRGQRSADIQVESPRDCADNRGM